MTRTLRLSLAFAALCMGATLVACASGQPTVVPSQSSSATPDSSPTVDSTAPASFDALEIVLQPFVTQGLEAPLYATGAGDGSGRVFIVEQPGRIRVARDGKLAAEPYLDIADKIDVGGERGLLGLAFAPDFAQSGRFFVDYTRVGDGATVIELYVADDPASDTPNISAGTPILTIAQPYSNHNGGCVEFGPDGYLYIGMGDGGSAGDPENRAQNPDQLLGKLLRIDVSAAEPGSPKYTSPKDNPFGSAGVKPGDGRREIYALGLRNPWRFSFDPKTRDLWIGDVGQNAWEEIDVIATDPIDAAQPLDFGWRLYEGTHPYDPKDPPAPKKGLTFPIVEYDHATGESVTGGYVYRGSAYPALDGVYLYADFTKGKVWGLLGGPGVSTSPRNRELLDTSMQISSFGRDDDGELYVVDLKGGVYRVTAK